MTRIFRYDVWNITYPRIVHVGANIGWFTLLAASHDHHVMAIEASPCNTRVLKANIQVNDHQSGGGHFSQEYSGGSTIRGPCVHETGNWGQE